MSFSEIFKTLDISTFKVIFFSIFSKSALVEYLCDKANNAINALMDANPENVKAIRNALSKILDLLFRYWNYIPVPWIEYVNALCTCLKAVLSATDDGKIVTDEAKNVIEAAMVCYSQFKAD